MIQMLGALIASPPGEASALDEMAVLKQPDDRISEQHDRLIAAFYERAADEMELSSQRSFLISGYHQIIGVHQGSPRRLSDGDLRAAYYLALDVAAVAQYDGALDAAVELLGELDRRASLSDRDVHYLHQGLIGARRFEAARNLRAAYLALGLTPPPDIVGSVEPAATERVVFAVSADGSLRRETIDMAGFSGVVVIAAPSCRFAGAAADAILSKPELADYFEQNSFWIAPASLDLSDDRTLAWNNFRPSLQLRFAERSEQWPELNYWGSPSFYFMKDGGVISKRVGWPLELDEQNLDELEESLSYIQ